MGPSYGTLDYFNSDGSFKYTPNPGFTGTDSFTYYVNDGMENSEVAAVTIDVDDVTLHWVTFVDEHEISSDPPATGTATLYDEKHWLDENLDGDATDQNDHLWPVAYTRTTLMKVSAELVLDNAWKGGAILVKADGPGNLDIHSTVANVTGEKITITAVAAANAFPNSVEHYDNFDLAWQLSTDGGFTWIDAGTSSNDLYLTLNDPSITTLYHTVVDIGSHNADGEDTELAVFTAIWGEFSGLNVKRVDGTQMGYWIGGDNTPANFDTRSLLRDANGRCGAWGDFMQDVLSAQGIASNRISVTSNDDGVTGLLVKNWVFFQDGIHNQFGPYKWEVNLDVNPINGIEAQKNADPKSLFGNHCIVEYSGKYYDPSYGQGPFATQADWENGSLDGFYKVFNVNGQNTWIAKKNDPNVIETNFVAVAQ